MGAGSRAVRRSSSKNSASGRHHIIREYLAPIDITQLINHGATFFLFEVLTHKVHDDRCVRHHNPRIYHVLITHKRTQVQHSPGIRSAKL